MWLNKSEVDNWLADSSLSEYQINDDPNPIIIKKKTNKKLELKQSIKVNYLRPPTPPQPGEIIIEKEPNKIMPPAPPIIIRQLPDQNGNQENNDEPLIVREAPPNTNLQKIEPQIITIPGKILPPPPRKVIINREYYYINGECKHEKTKTKKEKEAEISPEINLIPETVNNCSNNINNNSFGQAYYQPATNFNNNNTNIYGYYGQQSSPYYYSMYTNYY